MNIREFAFNLQKLYAEMADTFSQYQSSTTLNCPKSCGRCCMNPDVEASVMEMLPLALKIYDEQKLDEWLSRLEQNKQAHCLLFIPGHDAGQGSCGSYQERPSVCRMFGVAGTFDKHHKVTLSICKYIKEAYPELPVASSQTPLIPDWSSRLSALDPELVQKKWPMNTAIKKALEKIAFNAEYQEI